MILALLLAVPMGVQATPVSAAGLELVPCTHLPAEAAASCGEYSVWEDREARSGRRLSLAVTLLHARGDDPAPDPLVFFAGGPGTAATAFAPGFVDSALRERRDIVLVDQRGTAGAHRLACPAPAPDLQLVLDAGFDVAHLLACRDSLAERADLTQYTTPSAMDDVAEVLDALGYGPVNLLGGSYGTRAALIFMRRHTERVRCAVLEGVAPLAFKNPLYHARGAQDALDALFEACAADPDCQAAMPDVAREFEELLVRLDAEPATLVARDPRSGEETALTLSRAAFAEGLRKLTYTSDRARRVPALLHVAHAGNFRPLVEDVLAAELGIFDAIAMGMLLCVTCPEDVLRITEAEILEHTAGSYLGDGRVRRQLAICKQWPLGELPPGFAEPVTVEVPTLILSGRFDPVTPPSFGALLAAQLPDARHLVLPVAHDLWGSCPETLELAFIEAASTAAVDDHCVTQMEFGSFALPR